MSCVYRFITYWLLHRVLTLTFSSTIKYRSDFVFETIIYTAWTGQVVLCGNWPNISFPLIWTILCVLLLLLLYTCKKLSFKQAAQWLEKVSFVAFILNEIYGTNYRRLSIKDVGKRYTKSRIFANQAQSQQQKRTVKQPTHYVYCV